MSKFVTDSDAFTIVREIKRSVFVEGREWFDKEYGNTYFSARVWVDGQVVATLPFQYGYGDMYLFEAASVLRDMGYLEEDTNALSTYAKDYGFDLYHTLTTHKKSEMFKEAK